MREVAESGKKEYIKTRKGVERVERNSNGLRDMTVGSPAGHIVLFALPLLAGSFLQQLYNMVDSWVVGNYVGDAALAEELTEQTFFKAMKALNSFRGDCDVRVWLCSMARNQYISYLRKNKGAQNIDDVQIPDPRKSIEERAADKDQAMAVHRVLHDMPEPYKEVFTLRIFGQLAFNDIGRLFGRSANWACVTYHRACRKIQSEMEEEK